MKQMPRGRVAHYMILGKFLPLLDLYFPSYALKASCWLRNDRILNVWLVQKHSPSQHSQASDAELCSVGTRGRSGQEGTISVWLIHSSHCSFIQQRFAEPQRRARSCVRHKEYSGEQNKLTPYLLEEVMGIKHILSGMKETY